MKLQLARTVFLLGLLAGSLLQCQRLPPCHMRDLAIRDDLGGGVAGGGRVVTDFILTNRTGQACALSGYPVAELLDGKGNVLTGAHFEHEPGVFPGLENQPMRTILLHPGGHAWFQVWAYDGMGSDGISQCSIVKKIRIALPGDKLPSPKTLLLGACLDGRVSISFLVSGTPPE